MEKYKWLLKHTLCLTLLFFLVRGAFILTDLRAMGDTDYIHGINDIEIVLKIEGPGGKVDGGGVYSYGETVTVNAISMEGYSFDGWLINGIKVSKNQRYQFDATEDKTLVANFNIDYKLEKPLLIADGDYLLALVNKQTSLGNYQPTDLVKIDSKIAGHTEERYLRKEAYEHLNMMWEDAQEEGINLYVTSAYRSFETQKAIFNRNVSARGEIEANRISARGGESEHQLGTTVDFVGSLGDALSSDFAYTPAGKWLRQNSYKYGFVMSYPEGKESITGYVFEPWHYRYIGVEEAYQWKESGLTLTEFLMTKPQYFKEKNEFVHGE